MAHEVQIFVELYTKHGNGMSKQLPDDRKNRVVQLVQIPERSQVAHGKKQGKQSALEPTFER